MHFGPHKISLSSHWEKITCLSLLIILAIGCKDDESTTINFSSPNQGDNFNLGDDIKLKLDISEDANVSSVAYFIDGKPINTGKFLDSALLKTANLSLLVSVISILESSLSQSCSAAALTFSKSQCLISELFNLAPS